MSEKNRDNKNRWRNVTIVKCGRIHIENTNERLSR